MQRHNLSRTDRLRQITEVSRGRIRLTIKISLHSRIRRITRPSPGL
jgi:hypothetical protein